MTKQDDSEKRWITTEGGQHVLIDNRGRVHGGLGGNVKHLGEKPKRSSKERLDAARAEANAGKADPQWAKDAKEIRSQADREQAEREAHPLHYSKLPDRIKRALLDWTYDASAEAKKIGQAAHGAERAGMDPAEAKRRQWEGDTTGGSSNQVMSEFGHRPSVEKVDAVKDATAPLLERLQGMIREHAENGVDLKPYIKHNNLIPRAMVAKLKPNDSLFRPVEDHERFSIAFEEAIVEQYAKRQPKNSPGQMGMFGDGLGGNKPLRSAKKQQSMRWITIHPNGPGTKGTHVMIDDDGTVQAGAGGKLNGMKIGSIHTQNAKDPKASKPKKSAKERLDAARKAADKAKVEKQVTAGRGWDKSDEQKRLEADEMDEKFAKHREERRNRYTGTVEHAINNDINPYQGFTAEKEAGHTRSPYDATYKVVFRDSGGNLKSTAFSISGVRDPRMQMEGEARKLNKILFGKTNIIAGTAPIRGSQLSVAEAIAQHEGKAEPAGAETHTIKAAGREYQVKQEGSQWFFSQNPDRDGWTVASGSFAETIESQVGKKSPADEQAKEASEQGDEEIEGEEAGIEMPTLSNDDAKAGDQLGLIEGEGKRKASPKFKTDEKGDAKQRNLIDGLDAAAGQMDFFGGDGTPDDMVHEANRKGDGPYKKGEKGPDGTIPLFDGEAEKLNKAHAKMAEDVRERIEDFGEKIGGARKDRAKKLGPRDKTPKEKDARKTWQKRYEVSEMDGGTFTVHDKRKKSRWGGTAYLRGQDGKALHFDTKEEAQQAMALHEVARNHRVTTADYAGRRDGSKDEYVIAREVSDRKRPIVKGGFKSREEAMEYMAKNPHEVIEHPTAIDDRIHPVLHEIERTGEDHREGKRIGGKTFHDKFGFRGVEFGKWNNNAERQTLLNHAHDAMHDLAAATGLPLEKMSLDGELALGFGSRGTPGAFKKGANAHYERSYGAINLTKMRGAGSLAHEWFHALDHHLGRQSGKASSDKIENKHGDQVFDAKHPSSDYVSHGHGSERFIAKGYDKNVKKAFDNVMDTIMHQEVEYTKDTGKADRFHQASEVELDKKLSKFRDSLAQDHSEDTYKPYRGKRANMPLPDEQMKEVDQLIQAIKDGKHGEKKQLPASKNSRSRYAGLGNPSVPETLHRLAEIYKSHRGRQPYWKKGSGYGSSHTGPLLDINYAIQRRELSGAELKKANDGVKEKSKVRTDYHTHAKYLDEGSRGDYWSTAHELASRAFESYVDDKVAAKGDSHMNNFLAHAKHNDHPEYKVFNVKPYPEGEERKKINAAFDKLMQAIASSGKSTDRYSAGYIETKVAFENHHPIIGHEMVLEIDRYSSCGTQKRTEFRLLVDRYDVQSGELGTKNGHELVEGNEGDIGYFVTVDHHPVFVEAKTGKVARGPKHAKGKHIKHVPGNRLRRSKRIKSDRSGDRDSPGQIGAFGNGLGGDLLRGTKTQPKIGMEPTPPPPEKFAPKTRLDEAIVEAVGRDPEDVTHMRDLVDDAHQMLTTEISEINDDMRNLLHHFGYSGKKTGHAVQMARRIKNKGTDVAAVTGFDLMVDYAVNNYPHLLKEDLGESTGAGDYETALVDRLADGFAKLPAKHDERVIKLASQMFHASPPADDDDYDPDFVMSDEWGGADGWMGTEDVEEFSDIDAVPFAAFADEVIERYRALAA